MLQKKFNADEINDIVEKNRDEILDLLTETLRTPSPTGEEAGICRVFEKKLAKAELEIEVHEREPGRPNIIANWTGNAGGPTFIFLGHCDVFPPAEGNPGMYGPWSGKIVDGDIYARGSADMKSGDVAAIMAVTLLKRSGYIPNGNVKMVFTCDEEKGGKNGSKFLLSRGLLEADFGINMEASLHGDIVTKADGTCFLSITYHSDSLSPGEEGMDALQKAMKAVEKLYAIDEVLKRDRYHFGEKVHENYGAILSVTRLHTVSEPGKRPHECEIYVDRRVAQCETPESAKREIRTALDACKKDQDGMEYTMSVLSESGLLAIDEKSKCIQSIIEASRVVFGKEPEFLERCSGGDATAIVQRYGYPLPHFGPGYFEQLGIPDEKVPVQDVIDYIKAYMMVVQDMMG